MAGNKPLYKVVAKRKSGGDRIEVIVVWPSKYEGKPPNAQLAKGVKQIVLEDGEVITPGDYYIDFYDNREKSERKAAPQDDWSSGGKKDDVGW